LSSDNACLNAIRQPADRVVGIGFSTDMRCLPVCQASANKTFNEIATIDYFIFPFGMKV